MGGADREALLRELRSAYVESSRDMQFMAAAEQALDRHLPAAAPAASEPTTKTVTVTWTPDFDRIVSGVVHTALVVGTARPALLRALMRRQLARLLSPVLTTEQVDHAEAEAEKAIAEAPSASNVPPCMHQFGASNPCQLDAGHEGDHVGPRPHRTTWTSTDGSDVRTSPDPEQTVKFLAEARLENERLRFDLARMAQPTDALAAAERRGEQRVLLALRNEASRETAAHAAALQTANAAEARSRAALHAATLAEKLLSAKGGAT